MRKLPVTITGALALLAGSLLISDSAQAGGGSASAASKYANANLAAHQARATQQAQRSDFAITEYSSSSAKNQQKH
jgi:hypothetical protein